MARSPVLIALACLGACADPTGPARDGEPVQTDATVYIARHVAGSGTYRQYGFAVVSRFLNSRADTVFLARCYPDTPFPIYGVLLAGKPHSDGAAYSPVWACVGHRNPIAVPPGATRTDTLQVRGPYGWDGYTHTPIGLFEGVFRLEYEVHYCREETGCRAPSTEGQSNAFRVVLE